MKNLLFSFVQKATLMFFITGFSLLFGQSTLVFYSFNDDLDPDPGAIGNPVLAYYNTDDLLETPVFEDNMFTINASASSGNYLKLGIDTDGYQNIALSFYCEYTAVQSSTGMWTVWTNTGTNDSFEQIGEIILNTSLGDTVSQNFSVNLPDGAEENPNLEIKIVSTILTKSSSLRIDNLQLKAGNPKIRIYTDTDVYIPHESEASLAYDTDFGTKMTIGSGVQKTFRIRNFDGAPNTKLNIDNIIVSGASPGDFTVDPVSLLDIDQTNSETGSEYKTFDIVFKPLADGIRTAEILVYSNAAPSPYIFNVIGTGSSCQLESVKYAINEMGDDDQGLPSDYQPEDLISGTSNNNSLEDNPPLWPTNENLFYSGNYSWYAMNEEKTVTFGSLDITGQKDVKITFLVAAFGTGSNKGVNNEDYIKLSVKKPDNTWSDEIVLYGSGDTTTKQSYGFKANSPLEAYYDGDNNPFVELNLR